MAVNQTIAWALWTGCGIQGYRKTAPWQEFVYQTTGEVLAWEQAKAHFEQFWELMPELKTWHQHPSPKVGLYTLRGRYCQNLRTSHACKMLHLVLGSLDDLLKLAIVEIDEVLKPQGGRLYLVLGDYLIWEVPAEQQCELVNTVCEVMVERAKVMLPDVAKDWSANGF